jgi:hypothetical protein
LKDSTKPTPHTTPHVQLKNLPKKSFAKELKISTCIAFMSKNSLAYQHFNLTP